ncbi:MAG: hypothetical protein NTW48_03410 [Chloroflexi bacterium]|nr:hypothetical protein [Chloroflexota bacterium]
MKSNKKIWFLLLGLIGLLIGSLVACGMPGYTTYTNDKAGYTISHPVNWQVEVSEDGTKCLITSPTRRGSVMIDVVEGMTAREAAQRWLISIGTTWGEVIKLEDKPMQGSWDWYLSYDYEADFGTFHGEAYFKQTETHLYKLDTAGLKEEYSQYPFTTIISSFKLR